MNRRLILTSILAISGTAVIAPAASADASWCEDDPKVVIGTPTGRQLPLHVTNYAEGEENRVYLERVPRHQKKQNAWINWSIAQATKAANAPSGTPSGAVLWDVTIRVTIHTDPGDGLRFRTKTVASSDEFAAGVIYSQSQGTANREMEMRFSIWV